MKIFTKTCETLKIILRSSEETKDKIHQTMVQSHPIILLLKKMIDLLSSLSFNSIIFKFIFKSEIYYVKDFELAFIILSFFKRYILRYFYYSLSTINKANILISSFLESPNYYSYLWWNQIVSVLHQICEFMRQLYSFIYFQIY